MDKPKTKEELFNDVITQISELKEELENFRFHMACFVDAFQRYLTYDKEFKEFIKT